MKAILEFTLPEENEEHKLALDAGKRYSALWEIAQYVRTLRKYDERETLPKEEVIDKLNELLAEAEL